MKLTWNQLKLTINNDNQAQDRPKNGVTNVVEPRIGEHKSTGFTQDHHFCTNDQWLFQLIDIWKVPALGSSNVDKLQAQESNIRILMQAFECPTFIWRCVSRTRKISSVWFLRSTSRIWEKHVLRQHNVIELQWSSARVEGDDCNKICI